MSSDPDFSKQRSEIGFFMEKAFQISLAYFAGIVAFFALSRTDFMRALINATGLTMWPLVAVILLLLNLVYMTLACACLFAILKRGLFILMHSSHSNSDDLSPDADWERFVRNDSLVPTWGKLRALAWNIDNYYMMPLFAVIIGASVACGWIDFASGILRAQIAAGVLSFLYIVPAFMLFYMNRLNDECRRLLGH